MTINRKKFFDGIRQQPFPGKLSQKQVDGVNRLLDEYERREWNSLYWLAYVFATTMWETARTMQPIKEMGSQAYLQSKRYYPWIGRGYVQLTWKYNYAKFHPEVLELFQVDILADPDNAMIPEVAAYILFEGMQKGSFTSKKLADYFNARTTDWLNARRIINGTDQAAQIAAIGKQFYADLVAAS